MKLFFIIFISTSLFASNVEYYSKRPTILNIASSSHKAFLPPNWNVIKKAMLGLIAELVTFYPSEQIIFAGPEMEYVYDLAQLLFKDSKEINRFHLLALNVDMDDKNLGKYLAQNGLTSLPHGENLVVVATGFDGRYGYMLENATSELKGRIKTYLIQSDDPQIPSSRFFLSFFERRLSYSIDTRDGEDIVYRFERLPHYTKIPYKIELNGNEKYDAVSDPQSDELKRRALLLMVDLVSFAQNFGVRKEFENLVHNMRRVYSLLKNNGDQLIDHDELKKAGLTGFWYDAVETHNRDKRKDSRFNSICAKSFIGLLT